MTIRPAILGVGTAIPDHCMTQQEAAELAIELCELDDRQKRVVQLLYRKSGVEQRRTCLPHRIALDWQQTFRQGHPQGSYPGPGTEQRMNLFKELAFPLAARAAESALHQAAMQPSGITHLVTVSCTGFSAPGVDIQLMQHLGLPPTTQRVNVGFMGCHGAINGLRTAHGFTAVDSDARVLVCAVELCGLHYRFEWDPEHFMGNVLFSDGAAALVLGAGEERGGAAQAYPRLAATGSCLLPDSLNAMSWQIGDNGFEMTLSASVPELIAEHLRPWLAAWLAKHELTIEDIGYWAVHPGGPRILAAVEASLDLDQAALETSRRVLAELGNMSSPTVLFILERFERQGARGPGVMLGFGPGLVAEAALLD